MKHIHKIILCIVLLVFSVGQSFALMFFYSSIKEQNLMMLKIEPYRVGEEHFEFNMSIQDERSKEAVESVITWADKHGADVIIEVDFDSMGGVYYYNPKLAYENKYFTSNTNLKKTLISKSFDIGDVPPNFPIKYFENELHLPLEDITVFSGYLMTNSNLEALHDLEIAIENTGLFINEEFSAESNIKESVINYIVNDLTRAAPEMSEVVQDALSLSEIDTMMNNIIYYLENYRIYVGILVAAFFFIYSSLAIARVALDEYRVHRQFGLSKIRYFTKMIINYLLIFLVQLVMTSGVNIFIFYSYSLDFIYSVSIFEIITSAILIIITLFFVYLTYERSDKYELHKID